MRIAMENRKKGNKEIKVNIGIIKIQKIVPFNIQGVFQHVINNEIVNVVNSV